MKKILHIIFVFVVSFSLAGNTCLKSHSFVHTADAHVSSIEAEDYETEDLGNKEVVKNPHCCNEIVSSVSNNRSENTNSFKHVPDLSCKPAQDFSFVLNSFTTENWPSTSSQFQPDAFWLGTIVKRE